MWIVYRGAAGCFARIALAMMLQLVFRDQLPEHAFQFRDTPRQIVNRIAFRIGQPAVFQYAAFGPHADYAPGNAHHRGVVRYGTHHHGAGPHLNVVPNADIAEDFGAAPHHYSIAERRMAFAFLIAGAAQRNALVEEHVVADFGGFANHHAGPVVDE